MDIVDLQNWAYIEALPDDIASAREILHRYSGIPLKDVDGHILRVVSTPEPSVMASCLIFVQREDAWKVSRSPGIGRWKFLYLLDRQDPRYQQALFRLNIPRSKDALLDLGCCVGQVLRQFRADGVQGSQLFGTDIESKYINIGYNLFQDWSKVHATFVIGDLLDPSDGRLSRLHGKVTIIYAASFFHLFSWIQQLYVAKRLVGFLKPGTTNALIFGRQVGTTKGGVFKTSGASVYLHDQESFQRLWNEVGKLTKTRWSVSMEPTGEPITPLPGYSEDARPVNFTVYQVP